MKPGIASPCAAIPYVDPGCRIVPHGPEGLAYRAGHPQRLGYKSNVAMGSGKEPSTGHDREGSRQASRGLPTGLRAAIHPFRHGHELVGVTMVSLPTRCPQMSTTSLKLPEQVKDLVATAAESQGISAHAFMVNAISAAATSAQQHAQFVADAVLARHETRDSGKGYAAAAVHDWLRAKSAGRPARKPGASTWRK